MKKLALFMLLLSQCSLNYSLQQVQELDTLNDNRIESAPINDNIDETNYLDRQNNTQISLGNCFSSIARYCMDGVFFFGGMIVYNLDNVDRGFNLFGAALSSSVILVEGMINVFGNIDECINEN